MMELLAIDDYFLYKDAGIMQRGNKEAVMTNVLWRMSTETRYFGIVEMIVGCLLQYDSGMGGSSFDNEMILFYSCLMEVPSQMLLTAYRHRAQASSTPIISEHTEIFLRHCVTCLAPQSYCEIGTSVGYSMSVVYESMIARGRQDYMLGAQKKIMILTGFDVSLVAYRHAVARSIAYDTRLGEIGYAGLDCASSLISRHIFPFDICSLSAYGRNLCLHPLYDLIFIDARKILYTHYCEILVPYCKQTSMVIFDDMTTSSSKTQSLYSFLHKLQWKMIRIYPGDGDSLLVTGPSEVDRCCGRCEMLGMRWERVDGSSS
ncbi:MAG: hypothetical protein NZL83_03825 [Candidatus Absconditabacterales bacterium]|nr:hypothetical protein [Candidatus Absconditabacterales bacterium]